MKEKHLEKYPSEGQARKMKVPQAPRSKTALDLLAPDLRYLFFFPSNANGKLASLV
jgi:hypothetical protein